MEGRIDRCVAKTVARDADRKDQRRKLPKLWDELAAEVGKLDAAELVSVSEYGFDCQPGESAELVAVLPEDGRVMLDINIHGIAFVDVENLSESLREDVKRFLSLLPEGEVVA